MPTILVVEDEADLRRGVVGSLRREGYETLEAANGEEGLALALRERPDVTILDVMLPAQDGFEVCRELRSQGYFSPIIMLTAKSEEIDRVLGLEFGADDYVTKPFSMRELLARIRARLRREDQDADTHGEYRFGDVAIDFEKLVATKGGQTIQLTPREYDVLRVLIRSRGAVVTRERLLNEVWGYTSNPTTRTVDNCISKLRKKLENDPANPRRILSIYGKGYRFISE